MLLTGAPGGLGSFLAHAFADCQVKLALVMPPGGNLEELQKTLNRRDGESVIFVCDLRDAMQRRQLVLDVRRQLGPVDILINNAGTEFTSFYHELSEETIYGMLRVNLEAPMMLSWLVLPEMVERKRGHIVNISSLAGKSGPAFQEAYAATKAGLIAFTSSLRATYRPLGVSASVIVPGFVEAGIYAKLKAKSGCTAPSLLGTSPPEKVPRAVLRAIRNDLPEVIINPMPVRPLLALAALFPSLSEWVINKIGTNDFFRRVVEVQNQQAGKQ